MHLYCINPACRARVSNPRFMWSYEATCKKCWKRMPSYLRYGHIAARREWRYNEKAEIQGYPQPGNVWYFVAMDYAAAWAKIRTFFGAHEFPAGLDGFLHEVFRGR